MDNPQGGGKVVVTTRRLDFVRPRVYNNYMNTMTVTEILQTVRSSCDFSNFDGSAEAWMMLVQEKASDTGFGRLVDSILENGWEPNSAIGIYNGSITQGHHRLAAAILLGLDEVPVAQWGVDPNTLCAHSDQGVWREFDLWDRSEYPEEGYGCNITDCEYC